MLAVGRSCWLEGPGDCAAIAHVLKRRAKRARQTVERHAFAYSLNKPTDRAARARALPDGLSEGEHLRFQRLLVVAAGVLFGGVKNPCPGATHFGGMALEPDAIRARRAIEAKRWRRVVCTEQMANAFFTEVAVRRGVSGGGRR